MKQLDAFVIVVTIKLINLKILIRADDWSNEVIIISCKKFKNLINIYIYM